MPTVTGPACPAHAGKSTLASKLDDVESIAQRVAHLERDIASFTAIDITTLYEQLFLRHFGVKTRTAGKPHAQKFLTRVKELCTKFGIDPETYIVAQMDALKPWLSEPRQVARKMRFQPSMLSGENAARRYNGYLITAYYRMRKVDARALDIQSYEGKMVSQAYADELEIVSDYVDEVYAGGKQTYEQIATSEKRTPAWFALVSTSKDLKVEVLRSGIVDVYGLKYLRKLRRLIRFKVALATCERYRAGLSARLAARDSFTWNDFASAVKRLVPPRKRGNEADLTGIPGAEWGRHG